MKLDFEPKWANFLQYKLKIYAFEPQTNCAVNKEIRTKSGLIIYDPSIRSIRVYSYKNS